MSKLNEQQQAIIDAPVNGAYRVMAGPGSGKTYTLVRRIDKLIEYGVKPSSILAVTFSKAMATELAERAYKINSKVCLEQICTIHALAYRILKEEGETRKVASGKFGYLVKVNAVEALNKLGMPEVPWADFLKYVNNAKFHAIRHANLYSFYNDKLQCNGGISADIPWKADAANMLAQAHIEYDRLMQNSNVLTFNDMLCELEWLLQDNPSVLYKYQSRFQYIFVDEAQDTSCQAMRLLTLLAAPQNNFTAIGDVDQTIYAFAGAKPEDNMWQGFEQRFPSHQTFKLEINYRSTHNIITVTNDAIAANYNDETMQYRKFIMPAEGAGIGDAPSYNVYNTVQEEAQAISDAVYDLVWNESDTDFGDIFICARTRSQLAYLYGVLAKNKFPFVDKCGGSFWESAHIQDLMAYLKLSVNKMADESFLRIYNKASNKMLQPFDLYDKTTNKLIKAKGAYCSHRWLGKEFLNSCNGSYSGIFSVTDRRYQAGLNDLKNFMIGLNSLSQWTSAHPVYDKVKYVVDNCLSEWWREEAGVGESESNDGTRNEDFNTALDIAMQYNDLQEFIDYVDSMIKLSQESANKDDSKLIVLSTIHRLKGLERKVVMVMGVMDGLLPHWTISGNFGGSVLPFNDKNSIEDERRLFFVAVSRPKERLYLTGCYHYQTKKLFKSPFAYEVGLVDVSVVESALEQLEDDDSEDLLEE